MHPSTQFIHIYLTLREIWSFMATLPQPDEWWRTTTLFEVHFDTLVVFPLLTVEPNLG